MPNPPRGNKTAEDWKKTNALLCQEVSIIKSSSKNVSSNMEKLGNFPYGCILSALFYFLTQTPYSSLHHKQATYIPAMNNYRAGGGRCFFSSSFHFLHQLQKRRSLVWSLLIRPRGVPVLPQTTLLFPTLVQTHTETPAGIQA